MLLGQRKTAGPQLPTSSLTDSSHPWWPRPELRASLPLCGPCLLTGPTPREAPDQPTFRIGKLRRGLGSGRLPKAAPGFPTSWGWGPGVEVGRTQGAQPGSGAGPPLPCTVPGCHCPRAGMGRGSVQGGANRRKRHGPSARAPHSLGEATHTERARAAPPNIAGAPRRRGPSYLYPDRAWPPAQPPPGRIPAPEGSPTGGRRAGLGERRLGSQVCEGAEGRGWLSGALGGARAGGERASPCHGRPWT